MNHCTFLFSTFWISTKAVYLHLQLHPTALFGCYMFGTTWNCCCLGTFCVHHTAMHRVASLHLNVKPHTRDWVHACLAVTCRLHFLQNDQDRLIVLCAIAITQWPEHGGTHTEIRVSPESWPWRRKFACYSFWDSNPPFDHWVWHSSHWATPTPHLCCCCCFVLD